MSEHRFLTCAEAAPLLSMDESTIRDLYRKGVWPFRRIATKVGGRLKVSSYLLEQFIRGELEEAS